ncbi:MAG: hypothetical protein WCO26_14575 [Deltaproteobacteria bacterium]
MQYNKLGLFVFTFGILVFLGPLMLTLLGFFIWPGFNEFMMSHTRCGFLTPIGAVVIVIGGLINGIKDKEATK